MKDKIGALITVISIVALVIVIFISLQFIDHNETEAVKASASQVTTEKVTKTYTRKPTYTPKPTQKTKSVSDLKVEFLDRSIVIIIIL